jgi:hypothetical protein
MTATPRPVSRFEADVLRLLRFFFGRLPAEQAKAILNQRVKMPAGLRRNAVLLMEDTLRKGVVQFLVRAGGWRRDRFLKDGEPREGFVWRRLPVNERQLTFTEHVPTFLIWLAAERPSDARQLWTIPSVPPTLADQLLFLLAAQQLQAFPEQWMVLRRSQSFRANPLLWLAMPSLLADATAANPPDFAPPGPAILECLQGWLAERWIEADAAKAKLGDWRLLQQRGAYEDAALAGFLAAAENANRRDLARFLLRAIAERLRGEPDLAKWTSGLTEEATKLSERIAAKRSALSLLRPLEVFDRWDRGARGVGFFDDGYVASQFWKAEFDAVDGARLVAKYQRLLQELDPLQ